MPAPRKTDNEEMRAEYDLTGGVRGKHVERMKTMRLKVVLEPDVARKYPTSDAVNAALRRQAKADAAKRPARPTQRKKAG